MSNDAVKVSGWPSSIDDVAHVRRVDGLHAPLAQRIVDGARDQIVRDVVKDLLLEALLDDARRRLAGPEAGDARLARVVARDARRSRASTTSLGISTRTFLRVSLTSTKSVFIEENLVQEYGLVSRSGAKVVRKGGVEPPRVAPPDPKSGASASSATFACVRSAGCRAGDLQQLRITRVRIREPLGGVAAARTACYHPRLLWPAHPKLPSIRPSPTAMTCITDCSWHTGPNGEPCVVRHEETPRAIPCPTTGRPLRVSTLDAKARAICPKCLVEGRGGFVSFVADLRMAYACPGCRELVWLDGL